MTKKRTRSKRAPFTVRVPTRSGSPIVVPFSKRAVSVTWIEVEKLVKACARLSIPEQTAREALTPFVGQLNEDQTHAAMESVLVVITSSDPFED